MREARERGEVKKDVTEDLKKGKLVVPVQAQAVTVLVTQVATQVRIQAGVEIEMIRKEASESLKGMVIGVNQDRGNQSPNESQAPLLLRGQKSRIWFQVMVGKVEINQERKIHPHHHQDGIDLDLVLEIEHVLLLEAEVDLDHQSNQGRDLQHHNPLKFTLGG